jgi:hypothetical protein
MKEIRESLNAYCYVKDVKEACLKTLNSVRLQLFTILEEL